jgi:hypothetical protein
MFKGVTPTLGSPVFVQARSDDRVLAALRTNLQTLLGYSGIWTKLLDKSPEMENPETKSKALFTRSKLIAVKQN